MADWKVHLVFSEGSSNKFWRAKVDGGALTTNWGRVGTDGQSKTKDCGGASEALAELEKQAGKKRKKGYVDGDGGGGSSAEEAAPPPEPVKETWSATMKLAEEGRVVELTLAVDGKSITTSVTESFDTEDSAKASFARIRQKLIEDGYRSS